MDTIVTYAWPEVDARLIYLVKKVLRHQITREDLDMITDLPEGDPLLNYTFIRVLDGIPKHDTVDSAAIANDSTLFLVDPMIADILEGKVS